MKYVKLNFMVNAEIAVRNIHNTNVFLPLTNIKRFKVALDPCYNYVCIYFKSMHELRRLKPTTIEMFMRIYFLKFFV